MKHTSSALLVVFVPALTCFAQVESLSVADRERLSELDRRPIHQFKNADLSDYLQLRGKSFSSSKRAAPRDEVGLFGKRAIGQPFRLFAVQFDLAESDCVSFVNTMLALSVASDWQSYSILVERLRQKDGNPDYRSRNFDSLADWVPNNAWLLKDVTGELGPPENKAFASFTYLVKPKIFVDRPSKPGSKFTKTVFQGFDKDAVAEVKADSFIPTDRVADIFSSLSTGDVVLVLIADTDGHLRADHHALIVREPDAVNILHSTMPRVREEPLITFLKRCHWVTGFKFLRLRDDARELAAQEASRVASKLKTLSPIDQDIKVEKLRAARMAKTTRPAN